MQTYYPVLAAIVAYLLGSLSFAVIVSRVMGLNDPRTYGSKNPGATNVLRSGSKKAAVVTLLLDGAKGWLPVALVHWYGKPYGLEAGTVALVGLGAFLGHLYPVFFRFAGGKGVATAAGVLLGMHWGLGLATLLTWILIAVFFRYSSLAALVAAVFAPDLLHLWRRAGLVSGWRRAVRHRPHVPAADLPPRREHWPPGPRHGNASGPEESLSPRLRPSGRHARPVAG
jgi:acyl phosphate:glycerol-3-phosphate acyltransferase